MDDEAGDAAAFSSLPTAVEHTSPPYYRDPSMSSSEPSNADLLTRARGIARLLATLGDPATVEQLAGRVCESARRQLGVDAAALFICGDDGGPIECVAADGLAVEPPADLPGSLAAAALARLRGWAADAGFGLVELAPLVLDGVTAGVLALFLIDGAPFDADDLQSLGTGVAQALDHLRGVHELSRVVERQDREHDQLLRAERMRALGDMALGIAHDFNNVLNAILAQVGALAALHGPDAPPAATEALERLRKVALDGAATVGRVQEFSGQRRDREFEPVDVATLVGAVGDELRLRAPAGVRVEVQVAGARHPVLGSVGELRELLHALVENALEAVGEAGTVALELALAGEQLTLVVSDSGAGMSPAVRRRALDPFFTTKPRKKGLGLSVAWSIVRRHGGLLELDSHPGGGTRVRVRLPLVDGAAPGQPADAADAVSAEAGAVGRRVLLVEDDADNREAMSSLLSLGGFEVVAADCGAAGVRAFAPDRFDVVLTDLGLPDMDGWQVAGEIKRAAPATPIALITGWGLNLDRDEIRRRGVDLLVKKPIDPRVFLKQIENLVQLGGRKPSA
jgi:signal transduction histidine kinase/CheY-like chemotaxis protein